MRSPAFEYSIIASGSEKKTKVGHWRPERKDVRKGPNQRLDEERCRSN